MADEAKKRKPHVVAVPLPFQGHINPLMELCKQLAANGCSITFLNSDLNHHRILRSQQISAEEPPPSYVPFFQNEGLDFRLMPLGDGFPPVAAARQVLPTSLEELALNAAPPSSKIALQRVMDRLVEDDTRPVTCLVSDMRLDYTQDIVDRFGIPRVAFWTQSAASFASNLVVSNGFRPPPDDTVLISCIPGAPPHKRSEVSLFPTADPSHPAFAFATRPFHRMGEAAWILLNTFDEMEQLAMVALRKERGILTLGPLLPSPFFNFNTEMSSSTTVWTDYRSSCLDWLDTQAPGSVIYVSFGTLANRSTQQLSELAHGLEASGQPFLGVFRPDPTSVDSASFLQDVLHRTEERAIVVPWAPQLDVLSHRSVGGFLTHCGWNSTLESVSKGIPMLTWPTSMDQGLNARCIADEWRIGLSLEANESGYVERKEVEKKVKELMKGEKGRQIRENVCKLRDAARIAVAKGGSSTTNFELFLSWLLNFPSRSPEK